MKIFDNALSYINDKKYRITIFDNHINIINYIEIKEFSTTKIIIKNPISNTTIYGKNLVITKMQDDELLITGNINNIDLR